MKEMPGRWLPSQHAGDPPGGREWRPPPAFLPGESRGQRSLVGYSPRGCQESNTTDRRSTSHRMWQSPRWLCTVRVDRAYWGHERPAEGKGMCAVWPEVSVLSPALPPWLGPDPGRAGPSRAAPQRKEKQTRLEEHLIQQTLLWFYFPHHFLYTSSRRFTDLVKMNQEKHYFHRVGIKLLFFFLGGIKLWSLSMINH